MSNAGQAVLGIAGAVVGFFVTGGNPMGAVYGFQLGYLAGTALFPTQLPHMQGPRMGDGQQTVSIVGQPIPWIFGTQPVGGNIIWASPIREVANTETQGGKGGPEQDLTSYTYYRSFAILLCEGPIGGVRRIWANGKIIFDESEHEEDEDVDPDDLAGYYAASARAIERAAFNDSIGAKMTIYLGTEDQMPDPVIESFEGAGNVPAHRGYAYVVFDDVQLRPEDGNRLPGSWKFEVYEEGEPNVSGLDLYSNEILYDWAFNSSTARSPENQLNVHEYQMIGPASVGGTPVTGAPVRSSWEATLADYEDFTGYSLGGAFVHGWSIGDADELNAASDTYSGAMRPHASGSSDISNARAFANLHIQTATPSNGFYTRITDHGAVSNEAFNLAVNGLIGTGPNQPDSVWWTMRYEGVEGWSSLRNGLELGIYWWAHPHTVIRYSEREMVSDNVTIMPAPLPLDGQIKILHDIIVRVQRVPQAPPDPAEVGTPVGIDNWYVIDGQLVQGGAWILDESTTYRVLQEYAEDGGGPTLVKYPLNPARPVGHPQYDSEAFWTAAYEIEVARERMPTGLVYGVNYPVTQSFGYRKANNLARVTVQPVSLASIVSRVCERAGLTAYEVADLESRYVVGYQVSRPMAARAAIEPLRSVGFFDCVESGTTLRFPTRGKAIVATLEDDDLGARFHDEDTRPALITTRKKQEFEMPRQIRVHFQNPAADYDPGQELSPSRFDTPAESVVDIDLAVAIDSDYAAQIAEVLYREFWAGRWTHDAAVDVSRSYLEPADCIAVPIDGRLERVRIPALTERLPNLRMLELMRDDDGTYVSTAVGSTTQRPPDRVTFHGPVQLWLLDLPALSTEHDDAGFYAAAHPLIAAGNFRGAVVTRSRDGGGNYSIIETITTPVTAGTLYGGLPAGPTTIFDEGNEILVDLRFGELESRTEQDVLDGANAAAIGADGRWEIVQFKNATLIGGMTWRLSGLLRGRKGTEHAVATHVDGDSFVMLSAGGLVRLPLDVAEVNLEQLYKGTSIGSSPESVAPLSFTSRGVALKPYSPVHVTGERTENGAIVISWVRRDRLAVNDIDVPMSESVEDYEVDIFDEDGEVIRTASVSEPSFTYTYEDQLTDLGIIQDALEVRVYQISQDVGRGYPTAATIAPPPPPARSTDLSYLRYVKGPYPGESEAVKLAYRMRFDGYVIDFTQNSTGSGSTTLRRFEDGELTQSGSTGAFDLYGVWKDPSEPRYFFIIQLHTGNGIHVGPGVVRRIDSEAFTVGGIIGGVTTHSANVGDPGDPQSIVQIGANIYLTCPYDGTIEVRSAADLSLVTELMPSVTALWTLMTDGTDLYALRRAPGADAKLVKIDMTDGSTLASFDVVGMPLDGVIVGDTAYVISGQQQMLARYSLADGSLLFTRAITGEIWGSNRNFLTLDGNLLSVGRDNVFVLNTETDTEV